MIVRRCLLIFFCSVLKISSISGYNFSDLKNYNQDSRPAEPLFVSLGSHCTPAHMLKFCNLRKASFPLDWLCSFDGEALINMLRTDFEDVLDEKFFIGTGPFFHEKYHLEFLHDGKEMSALLSKYTRRINRFRQLREYLGRLFFIRSSYACMLTDPHRHYKFPEIVEISKPQAMRIYKELKAYFPKQEISLVIINYHEGVGTFEDTPPAVGIRIFRMSSKDAENTVEKQTEHFKAIFTKLLAEDVRAGSIQPSLVY